MKLSTNTIIGRLSVAAAVTMLAMVGSGARADLYQYVINGGSSTFSGSIGTTTFTNATWSLSNIFDPAAGIPLDSGVSRYSTTAQFTVFSGASTYVYDIGGPAGTTNNVLAGVVPAGTFFGTAVFDQLGGSYGGAFLSVTNASLSLVTPGTFGIINNYVGPAVATTQGNIVLTNWQNGFGSLTISQYGASAVPEPAEWAGLAMLGSGLGGLVVRARRRKVTA
jgi:hypothetical protein